MDKFVVKVIFKDGKVLAEDCFETKAKAESFKKLLERGYTHEFGEGQTVTKVILEVL